MKGTAIHMDVWITVCYDVLENFEYILSGGIAGPCNSSILSFLRTFYRYFHSGCTHLHSHQQSIGRPLSHMPVLPVFALFYVSHSDWHKKESSESFDLHFSDTWEHWTVFKYLLEIYISSVNCLCAQKLIYWLGNGFGVTIFAVLYISYVFICLMCCGQWFLFTIL